LELGETNSINVQFHRLNGRLFSLLFEKFQISSQLAQFLQQVIKCKGLALTLKYFVDLTSQLAVEIQANSLLVKLVIIYI